MNETRYNVLLVLPLIANYVYLHRLQSSGMDVMLSTCINHFSTSTIAVVRSIWPLPRTSGLDLRITQKDLFIIEKVSGLAIDDYHCVSINNINFVLELPLNDKEVLNGDPIMKQITKYFQLLMYYLRHRQLINVRNHAFDISCRPNPISSFRREL